MKTLNDLGFISKNKLENHLSKKMVGKRMSMHDIEELVKKELRIGKKRIKN